MREFWTANGLFQNSMQGKQAVGAVRHGVKEEDWHASTVADRSSLGSGFSVAPRDYNFRAGTRPHCFRRSIINSHFRVGRHL